MSHSTIGRRREILDSEPPFSLSCYQCDAGDDVVSKDQALVLGWHGVQRDTTGLGWNDLGWCPDCSRLMQQRDRELSRPAPE